MMSPSIIVISFVVDDVVSGKVVEVASLMEDAVIVLDDMVSIIGVGLTLIKEGVVTDGIEKGVNIISYDVDMEKDDIIVEVNIFELNEVEYAAELLDSMEIIGIGDIVLVGTIELE